MDIKLTDIFEEDELSRLAVLRANEPLVQKMYEYLEDNLEAITFFQAKMRKLAFALGNDIDNVIDNKGEEDTTKQQRTLIGVNDKIFERLMVLIDKSPKLLDSLRGFTNKKEAGKSTERAGPIARRTGKA